MVKLIRLASDNNCKFNADLDQGIKIKDNSQIALQNLTFDTEDFIVLQIGEGRDKVSFSLNRQGGSVDIFGHHHAFLKNASYNSTNINNFYKDLESKLNMCCKVKNSSEDNAYNSFALVYDNKPTYEGLSINGVYLIQKLNPMTCLFNFNYPAGIRQGDNILFDISYDQTGGSGTLQVMDIYDGTNGLDLGNIKKASGVIASADLDAYIYPARPDITFSRGNGMFIVRIHDLIDNGGVADTNGFEVGFSFTDLGLETNGGFSDMTNDMRDIALRVKRPTDDFEYVNPTSPHTNVISTGNAPFKFNATTDPDQLTHDLILFEKDAQIITCKVINTSIVGGNVINVFSYTMTDAEHEKPLYPYILVHGAELDTQIGLPVITVDNNINPLNLQNIQGEGTTDNDFYGIVGQAQEIFALGSKNVYEVYATNHGAGFVNSGLGFRNDIFDNDDLDFLEPYKPQLRLHTRILQNMGYDIFGSREFTFGAPTTQMTSNQGLELGQFSLEPDGGSENSASDNYIVVLDSHQLKSYDASEYDYSITPNAMNNTTTKRGRQKSILATIPVNNSNGVIEHEPNELIYIDMDNKFDIELKNLRLRVLNKQFGEIRTTGTSIMTLLIKD